MNHYVILEMFYSVKSGIDLLLAPVFPLLCNLFSHSRHPAAKNTQLYLKVTSYKWH